MLAAGNKDVVISLCNASDTAHRSSITVVGLPSSFVSSTRLRACPDVGGTARLEREQVSENARARGSPRGGGGSREALGNARPRMVLLAVVVVVDEGRVIVLVTSLWPAHTTT